MTGVEHASLWLQHRADSRGGALTLFVWAFAEAMVWPIIPDASLALFVAARPRRWATLAATTVAGSVAGGLAGFAASASRWSWPLPLTTDRMQVAADGWLSAGAQGLAHQPLSGVPYKVFVAAAPGAGIAPDSFALATLQYRAPRLVIVALLTAAVAAVAWRVVPRESQPLVHVAVSAVATAVLLAGLAVVATNWS